MDIALERINPRALVRDIRVASPCIRIMLIPLVGEEVPDELNGVEIPSLLPKPFFVDDLWAIVAPAMGWGGETIPRSAAVWPETHVAAPLAEQSASEGTPADSSGAGGPMPDRSGIFAIASQDAGRWRSQEKEIAQALKSLNREMLGEAITVSVGEELIASVGSIRPEQVSELVGLVSNSAGAADRAVKYLGESGMLRAESARGSSVPPIFGEIGRRRGAFPGVGM